MAQHTLTSQESYNPNHLLDVLIERLNLKNDAALCRALEVAPPVISKIRHRSLPVGASMLIRMHEVSQLSVRELRDLMGDRRTKYRLSNVQGKPKPALTAAGAENTTNAS
jgi:plasmid maintenance system antidote protein VapI